MACSPNPGQELILGGPYLQCPSPVPPAQGEGGDPGGDPGAERGRAGDVLPPAGQLIKFLQEPCNSPTRCPPRITHLPGKSLRSGLPSPSTSLFLIRRAGCWLVMRGSERSVPRRGGRLQAGSGPHPEMPSEPGRQDGEQHRGSRWVLAAVSLAWVLAAVSVARAAAERQSPGTALSWEGRCGSALCLGFPRRVGSHAPFGAARARGGLANGTCSYSGGGRGGRVSAWAMSRQLMFRDPTCRYWSILAPAHPLPCAAAGSLFPSPVSMSFPEKRGAGGAGTPLALSSVNQEGGAGSPGGPGGKALTEPRELLQQPRVLLMEGLIRRH